MTGETTNKNTKPGLPPEDVRIHKKNTENDDEDVLDNNVRINPINKTIPDQQENSERSSGGDTQGNP